METDALKRSAGPGQGVDSVFIAPLETKKSLQWQEAKAAAARLVDVRRRAMGELSKGKATFTQTLGTVKDERQVFYFSGVDPLNQKYFYVAVIGLPNVLVSVTLYRPLSAPRTGFEELSVRIMWSVRGVAG
jgi:hypothetical protein